MKLTFLGTCADDFSSKLKTDFKDKFDKNIRRSSAAIIDGHLLIDCGPHTLNALDIAHIDYSSIDTLVFTHLHNDHFNPANVETLAKSKKTPLNVYVREDAKFPEIENVNVIRMKLYEKTEISECFTVTGMSSNHEHVCFPQWLLFEKDDKKLLYAIDGGWIINTTYYFLRNKAIDFAVFDGTIGDIVGDYRIAEHNSLPMVKLLVASLRTFKVLGENAKVYITHVAPSLHKPHDEIVEYTKQFDADVAYDGLTVEI